MAKLTLSIGSNVGDRERLLAEAGAQIAEKLGTVRYLSETINTPAWGREEQADFLNQVIVVELSSTFQATPDQLHGLLDTTQGIERQLGRERKLHWGPRTVDIDLIFLDDVRYEDDRLSLPHPWWQIRTFVTDLLPGGLAHDGYITVDNTGE